MKKTFAALLTPVALVAIFAICALAQTVSTQCPKVDLNGPSDDVTAGDPITFSANVSGGNPNVIPKYNWTVSAGKISGGQGTSQISVDSTGAGDYGSITATVEIGGLTRPRIKHVERRGVGQSRQKKVPRHPF